jgi:hypothetical protein
MVIEMVGFELLFAKHAADITHLLGGRAYAIHQLPENEIETKSMQGALRAAWIVGQDGDGVKPHYDCDNIVSLIVARGGRTEISIGSLLEPAEECPRLNTLLEYCAYYEIKCTIGGDMTFRPRFSSSGK